MKGIQNTSSKTYRQLMGNGLRYEIPKFQRDYTWDTENWDDLWQDIKALLKPMDKLMKYHGYDTKLYIEPLKLFPEGEGVVDNSVEVATV
jgi:hypothetical protein